MRDLAKDWPVYLVLLGFVWMVSYPIVKTKLEEKRKREQDKTSQEKGMPRK